MRAWVPPKVSQELREESARREAETMKALVLEDGWDWVRKFNYELNRVVHGMKLAWCPDPAPVDAVTQGAQPGCWNLIWPGFNGGPLNVKPLVDEDGNPRHPGSWVFEMLDRADMWNDRAMRERTRILGEAREARARRKEQELANVTDDIIEHFLARTRAQVSMNTDTKWSQNHAGRRGVKE